LDLGIPYLNLGNSDIFNKKSVFVNELLQRKQKIVFVNNI